MGGHGSSLHATALPTISEVRTAVALAEMAGEADAPNGETVQDKDEKEMKNAQLKETIEEVASPVSEPGEHEKLLDDGEHSDCSVILTLLPS